MTGAAFKRKMIKKLWKMVDLSLKDEMIGQLAIFIASCAVFAASFYSESFAEKYSKTVSDAFRGILSIMTGFFPFSVAEVLVVIVLPITVIFAIYRIVRFVLFKEKIKAVNFFVKLLCASVILGTLFINCFGVCYNRVPIEKNLGIERRKITARELCDNAAVFKTRLSEITDGIPFDDTGASVLPYSWKELNVIIDDGYGKLCQEYDFISDCDAPAKKIALSKYMTYTHISGIYFPFTGEANVNTNYPDYVVAFSMAHEKAHQRGIAGEDEANFIAYLACMYSGDYYLEYCAQMSMYEYFLSAVLETDKDEYMRLISDTDKRSLGEMNAYYEFFEKYRYSAASEVANEVNDAYLKTLGEGDGVESYGLVIELMSAYLKSGGEAE